MGKLLETRLPIALNEVDAGVYNRMIRILEINLDRFDTTATPEYNDTELNQNQFNAGDVIWNTNKGTLQVYTGNKCRIYQQERRSVYQQLVPSAP